MILRIEAKSVWGVSSFWATVHLNFIKKKEHRMNFENVTVEVAGNSYFDGAVTSRTLHFADGSRKTLGFMREGDYTFGTDKAELMEITSGEVAVRLPESEAWITIKGGEQFNVPANSKFEIKVKKLTDYCCSYLYFTVCH